MGSITQLLTLADCALLYVAFGLIALLIIIRAASKSPEDLEDVGYHLGTLVIQSVLAWPYLLILWVFSWDIWLKPVRFFW
jgi:hypothetical protein